MGGAAPCPPHPRTRDRSSGSLIVMIGQKRGRSTMLEIPPPFSAAPWGRAAADRCTKSDDDYAKPVADGDHQGLDSSPRMPLTNLLSETCIDFFIFVYLFPRIYSGCLLYMHSWSISIDSSSFQSSAMAAILLARISSNFTKRNSINACLGLDFSRHCRFR